MPEAPDKTEMALYRALFRVLELPGEYRDAVLDRGMEEWLDAFLEKHPALQEEMKEREEWTRIFGSRFDNEQIQTPR